MTNGEAIAIMRIHAIFTATAIALASPAPARAQTKFPATLEGRAILSAMTIFSAPADALQDLHISGRYAGPTDLRFPFKGQPVQHMSGITTTTRGLRQAAPGQSDDNELTLPRVTDLLKAK